MQDKKVVFCLALSILIVLSAIATSSAFIHPDGSEDNYFETFGPRIDKIAIRKYSSLDAEMTGLQNGEIDITDWPLTATWANTLSSDPNIGVADYGGNDGYYAINFNHNNNTYLGNPPNPMYPNPVYPNPMSEIALRQACAYFINRTALTEDAGKGLYDPIYTPIPAQMAYWIHPEIRPGGAFENLTYPFDSTFAIPATLLDTGGFPVGPDGWRYWDLNRDGVKDAGEDLALKVYGRTDVLRKNATYMLCAGFDNPAIKIRYSTFYPSPIHPNPLEQKNYHIYTIGWIFVGPDPDYLWDLYHWDNYYYDGSWSSGPNMGSISINDPVMQEQLETMKYGPDQASVFNACLAFQERFAETASEVPLGSTSAPKACNKWYTGGNDGVAVSPDDGENAYRHANWDQIVNQKGLGENSWWSTLNMYPVGHPLGDGSHMTVRYGWQDTSMPATVNPMYSSWYWESELWGRSIDSMGARNPYTLGPVEVPQLADSFRLDTWVDPADGIEKSSVTVHMRCGVLWNDGIPATIDDFIYTLAQMPVELLTKGCVPVWWQPTFDQVAGFFKLDDYTGQILMKVNTYLAQSWILGIPCVPKHFWQPYIAANTPEVIQGDIAPGNLIGTGPFLYVENVPLVSALLVRNPTYYAKDPIFIVPSFVATGTSVNISPNKIKPNNNGFGNGTLNIVISDINLDVYNSVSCTMTATIQRVAPTVGPVILLTVTSPRTVGASATDVQTVAVNLLKGEYELTLTETITTEPYTGHVVLQNVHIKVTIAGDLNGDWIVDIFDIASIAMPMGATRGQPNYNANADINHDGIIDIFDIVQVALVFGWDP